MTSSYDCSRYLYLPAKSPRTRGTAIRTAIIEGRIKPNDHITEITLTEQLGVSRTPIREALILLEREGLPSQSQTGAAFTSFHSTSCRTKSLRCARRWKTSPGRPIISTLQPEDYEYCNHIDHNQKSAIERQDFKQVRTIDMAFHEYLIRKAITRC